MGTAVKINNLGRGPGEGEEQTVYRLEPPYQPERGPAVEYVLVSAAMVNYGHGSFHPETYLFPSDENGTVISWGELPGSIKGVLDGPAALNGLGYEVEA